MATQIDKELSDQEAYGLLSGYFTPLSKEVALPYLAFARMMGKYGAPGAVPSNNFFSIPCQTGAACVSNVYGNQVLSFESVEQSLAYAEQNGMLEYLGGSPEVQASYAEQMNFWPGAVKQGYIDALGLAYDELKASLEISATPAPVGDSIEGQLSTGEAYELLRSNYDDIDRPSALSALAFAWIVASYGAPTADGVKTNNFFGVPCSVDNVSLPCVDGKLARVVAFPTVKDGLIALQSLGLQVFNQNPVALAKAAMPLGFVAGASAEGAEDSLALNLDFAMEEIAKQLEIERPEFTKWPSGPVVDTPPPHTGIPEGSLDFAKLDKEALAALATNAKIFTSKKLPIDKDVFFQGVAIFAATVSNYGTFLEGGYWYADNNWGLIRGKRPMDGPCPQGTRPLAGSEDECAYVFPTIEAGLEAFAAELEALPSLVSALSSGDISKLAKAAVDIGAVPLGQYSAEQMVGMFSLGLVASAKRISASTGEKMLWSYAGTGTTPTGTPDGGSGEDKPTKAYGSQGYRWYHLVGAVVLVGAAGYALTMDG